MSDPNQNNSQNTEDNSELYPHEQRHDRHQRSVPSSPITPSSRDNCQIVSFSGAYVLCIDIDVSAHTCTIELDPDISRVLIMYNQTIESGKKSYPFWNATTEYNSD